MKGIVENNALFSAQLSQIAEQLADYVRNPAYGPATGAVNAYTFSAMAAAALVDGMSVYLDNVIAANTGASTFNWSGLGAKAIVDAKGNALTAGKMPLNCIVGLRYNANITSFQLLGEGGETLTGDMVAADLAAGKTGYSNNPANKITGTRIAGPLYLYAEGNECVAETGGWVIAYDSAGLANTTFTKNIDNIYVNYNGGAGASKSGGCGTTNQIDMTNYNWLIAEISNVGGNTGYMFTIALNDSLTADGTVIASVAVLAVTSAILAVNVSAINASHRVKFTCQADKYATIKKVWLQ